MPRSQNRLDGRHVYFEDEAVTESLSSFMAGSWTPSPMCESQLSPKRSRPAGSVGFTSTTGVWEPATSRTI
jgi:hypothetical protein